MSDYYQAPPDCLPLFDTGKHAAETRAAAFVAAKPKMPKRERLLLAWLADRGVRGGTRHEGAAAFGWPLSSICRPAQQLLLAGLVEEIGKRPSPYGSPAAVMVITDAGLAVLANECTGEEV